MNIQSVKRDIDYQKFYALVEKLRIHDSFKQKAKKDYFGSAPNVFVGRFGYPKVDVGILNTESYDSKQDNPRLWAQNNFEINDIIKIRATLINSNFRSQVKGDQKNKFLDVSKEVSMAVKAPDVEVNLKKVPQFNFSLDQELTPYGPSVKLDKARLTENPKIPKKVESVVNDDLKSIQQLKILYNRGFDENYLTKIMSLGNLGIETSKRLVPTRWSITATDDSLGKLILEELRNYSQIDHSIYFGGYLGNYYMVMMFPDAFRYELFEIDVKTGKVWTDYEDVFGRKTYASITAGGYYASRLPILEKLKSLKKQGSILVLRFVTEDYYIGLGVWVVREATRNSMNTQALKFASKGEMINYARSFAKRQFGLDIDFILERSSLLEQLGKQKKLFDF